jgi:hypothetical protein
MPPDLDPKQRLCALSDLLATVATMDTSEDLLRVVSRINESGHNLGLIPVLHGAAAVSSSDSARVRAAMGAAILELSGIIDALYPLPTDLAPTAPPAP